MIHLITGGSASGKSAYAEDWLLEAADEAQKGAYIYAVSYTHLDVYKRQRIRSAAL